MGFMGLGNIGDSDQAFDSMCACVDEFAKQLLKEVKETSNEYNTPGWVNTALIIKSLKDNYHFQLNDDMKKAAQIALKGFENESDDWNSDLKKDLKCLKKVLEDFIKDE